MPETCAWGHSSAWWAPNGPTWVAWEWDGQIPGLKPIQADPRDFLLQFSPKIIENPRSSRVKHQTLTDKTVYKTVYNTSRPSSWYGRSRPTKRQRPEVTTGHQIQQSGETVSTKIDVSQKNHQRKKIVPFRLSDCPVEVSFFSQVSPWAVWIMPLSMAFSMPHFCFDYPNVALTQSIIF